MATIQTSEQTLAAILAVAAGAENNYNDREQNVVAEISQALEMPNLPQCVATEVTKVVALQPTELVNYLIDAANSVSAGEESYIFEAVMQVVLADQVLAYTEASNLLIIANALHFSHDFVLLMMADAIKEMKNISVKFEE